MSDDFAAPTAALDPPAPSGTLWRWMAVLGPGLAIWFLPLPGLNVPQRHLLALLPATIVAPVAPPAPTRPRPTLSMPPPAPPRPWCPPARRMLGLTAPARPPGPRASGGKALATLVAAALQGQPPRA